MKKYVLGIVFLAIIPLVSWVWLNKMIYEPPSSRYIPAIPQPEPECQLVAQAGTIHAGETLESILLKYHLPRTEAQKFIIAFRDVYNVRKLKTGEAYCLYTDSLGKLYKFEYRPDLISVISVQRDTSDQIIGSKSCIPLKSQMHGIRGKINTTLYDAILEIGQTQELIIMFSDIFQWDIDFFIDPRVGDEFKILYQASYLLDPSRPDSVGPLVHYDRILAGQYCRSGKPMTAIYFSSKTGPSGYYDLDGNSFQKTFLKSPLNYRRISSYFSFARRHPILKIVRPHYGVDFSAPEGTPVVASADGIIVKKGYDQGIGNFIRIQHKNHHFETLYGHLSRFADSTDVGAQVKQRDLIGYVGTTGLSTGPHLHYTFYENGRPINPLKIKNSSGDPISSSTRPAFDQVKTHLLGYLNGLSEAGPQLIATFNPVSAQAQPWRASADTLQISLWPTFTE